ncbi:MAG: AgmX/PglI C-terminal domain-containing protein [Pseudomonadales bacterium]|nr:AgmX/PglI C-terminal domain-containing protein [Halioglobus sp.]MCP5121150.1 AgmX/PglI C-terminal domain-containing protein [Pseudomonadales bacterium]MCP5193510.1 AgmX/PglI C-terminal domain-containing protein [Pseudomonadales bacterium]
MSAMAPAPELRLPWESNTEDDRRFLQTLRTTLIIFGVFAIAVPLLPVPESNREIAPEVPPELVTVILEEKDLPEPVKPPPTPVEKKPEPPEPVETVKEQHRDNPTPVNRMEQARKVAAVSGVLAFQDDLSDMRDTVDLNELNQTQLRRGQESAAHTERAMITSGLPATSGGINTSALSRNAGGPALSGRETTRVQSTVASAAGKTGDSQSGKTGGRSDESIRRVMDNNKGAIFAIYNRALRQDPLLQGRLSFEMVIDPAGSVARLTLLSSELADPGLTRKILARIRLIDFGAEQVTTTSVHYSLDFLPYS